MSGEGPSKKNAVTNCTCDLEGTSLCSACRRQREQEMSAILFRRQLAGLRSCAKSAYSGRNRRKRITWRAEKVHAPGKTGPRCRAVIRTAEEMARIVRDAKRASEAEAKSVREGKHRAALPEPRPDDEERPKETRCLVCKKRLILMGFDCRCKLGKFCSVHRYTDQHNCPFNYKEQGAQEIKSQNPPINKDKFSKF